MGVVFFLVCFQRRQHKPSPNASLSIRTLNRFNRFIGRCVCVCAGVWFSIFVPATEGVCFRPSVRTETFPQCRRVPLGMRALAVVLVVYRSSPRARKPTTTDATETVRQAAGKLGAEWSFSNSTGSSQQSCEGSRGGKSGTAAAVLAVTSIRVDGRRGINRKIG